MLVPELLLIGQLIDRSGMALVHQARSAATRCCRSRSRSGWASSPIYTKRMQKALKYEGDDVITIFKGLQLDIGAPPQFMDFRYTVHDRWHGEFHLDHCGALMDVEPMGEDYVRGMCHDIEDPTFDATAVATNRKAQIRPDPPAAAGARRPAPALRVDGDHRRVLPGGRRPSRCSTSFAEPAPPERNSTRSIPTTKGRPTTRARWCPTSTSRAFSHSALVRIADEVCLQMHLLNLSFVIAVGKRAGTDTELATKICTKQLIGIAGIAAERIHRALDAARRHRGRAARTRTAPAAQPGGIRDGRVRPGHRARAPLARPRGRRLDLAGHPGRRTGRCRRSSQRSTRISTWR